MMRSYIGKLVMLSATELPFEGTVSVPLLWEGITLLHFIIKANNIEKKIKILLIINIIASTISDGFFLFNLICIIDRILATFCGSLTLIKILFSWKESLSAMYILKVFAAGCCFCMARHSNNFNAWNNYHYLWHIFVFHLMKNNIKNNLYA